MLEQLLDNLNSRDKALREDAERHLCALTPEELLQFSKLENTCFKKWAKIAWVKIIVAVICTYIGLLVMTDLLSGVIGQFLHHVMNGMGYGLFMGWAGYFRFKQQPYARHALALAIGEINDVRFAPVLMTMLLGMGCSADTKQAVSLALARLLPHLRLEDTYRWTPEQREALMSILKAPLVNFPASLATLHLMRDSKEETFWRQARKIANMKTAYTWHNKPSGISAETAGERARQVKQAAQECLRLLDQQKQETAQAQTLLRASAPAAAPDTLLRAANAAPTADNAEQLLRAGGEP